LLNVVPDKANPTWNKEQLQKLILSELPRLRRFAYALTQNQHDMEDLLQGLVEKLLTQSLPSHVKPMAWIFRVTKNLWIDELRKRKTKGIEIPIEESQVETGNNAENIVSEAQQKQRVLTAMQTLPEQQRMVLSLVMSAEMSYADTADILDIPIGTVMSRLARARENLSKQLKQIAE